MCHDTKYDGVLDEWKKMVADLLAKAEASYAEADAALKGSKLEGLAQLNARRLLDEADYNIRLCEIWHGAFTTSITPPRC